MFPASVTCAIIGRVHGASFDSYTATCIHRHGADNIGVVHRLWSFFSGHGTRVIRFIFT